MKQTAWRPSMGVYIPYWAGQLWTKSALRARAYAHLYWTGEGRRTPRIRFLLPISVRTGKLIEPESPRLTPIR
jgi:hypothetical protein